MSMVTKKPTYPASLISPQRLCWSWCISVYPITDLDRPEIACDGSAAHEARSPLLCAAPPYAIRVAGFKPVSQRLRHRGDPCCARVVHKPFFRHIGPCKGKSHSTQNRPVINIFLRRLGNPKIRAEVSKTLTGMRHSHTSQKARGARGVKDSGSPQGLLGCARLIRFQEAVRAYRMTPKTWELGIGCWVLIIFLSSALHSDGMCRSGIISSGCE